MRLEAVPVQFVAVTDGVLNGEEHVLLFVENANLRRPCGFALTLADARMLQIALRNILPEAREIQQRIREQN
ncbi:MAG: hypothetical protein ACRELF_01490 [Gemmataceae bacterium]